MTGDREIWENNKELRDSVEQRLRDWGWHMFGGEPDLGYPNHSNFTTPPKPDHARYQPEHGVDDARAVEDIITSTAQASLHAKSNQIVLRLQYARRDLDQTEKARRIGASRRTFRRRLDEARFWFWRQAQMFDEVAKERARQTG